MLACKHLLSSAGRTKQKAHQLVGFFALEAFALKVNR